MYNALCGACSQGVKIKLFVKKTPLRENMSLLFVELKMRGEFPKHGRKVEILIEQAAEQAYHSAVYRRDDESAPPDALKAPEKRERHYRRYGENHYRDKYSRAQLVFEKQQNRNEKPDYTGNRSHRRRDYLNEPLRKGERRKRYARAEEHGIFVKPQLERGAERHYLEHCRRSVEHAPYYSIKHLFPSYSLFS